MEQYKPRERVLIDEDYFQLTNKIPPFMPLKFPNKIQKLLLGAIFVPKRSLDRSLPKIKMDIWLPIANFVFVCVSLWVAKCSTGLYDIQTGLQSKQKAYNEF